MDSITASGKDSKKQNLLRRATKDESYDGTRVLKVHTS